jgi:hypothetical protein
VLRHLGQDNRFYKVPKRLRSFRAGLLILKGLGEGHDLLPVQVGHSRMQERRRFVRGCKLRFQFLALAVARCSIRSRFISRVNSWQNSSKRPCPSRLLLQRAEHARFDLVAPDGQVVVAPPLVPCAKASEPVRRGHDESRAADAALVI